MRSGLYTSAPAPKTKLCMSLSPVATCAREREYSVAYRSTRSSNEYLAESIGGGDILRKKKKKKKKGETNKQIMFALYVSSSRSTCQQNRFSFLISVNMLK